MDIDIVRTVAFGNFSVNAAPRRQHFTQGDGNCFFRAISFVVTGSEDLHQLFRKRITDHMINIDNSLRVFLIRNEQMNDDGVWATENEILAAASLLETDILVYAAYGLKMDWLRYPASLSLDILTSHAIFLSNQSGNHFNVVLSA